jgi:hypothetical protein
MQIQFGYFENSEDSAERVVFKTAGKLLVWENLEKFYDNGKKNVALSGAYPRLDKYLDNK